MTTILIAASKPDADRYLDANPRLKPAVIVTPRSMKAAQGHTGPVYVTAAGYAHDQYKQMLHAAAPTATVIRAERAPQELGDNPVNTDDEEGDDESDNADAQ